MKELVKQIDNTSLHHLHGMIVTAKGKPYRQQNVSFTVKGRKQVRLTRAQGWLTHLTKLVEGFPIHLVDLAEELHFKEILLPTYEDYVVHAPYVCKVIKWEDLELYILPGFLGNAVAGDGKIYELYADHRNKDWYWQEIYPNQNGCYDLINSIDGDMLEVSVDDIIYLLKSCVVTGDDLSDYYAKRVVSRRAEVALEDGWVEIDPKDISEPHHVAALKQADQDHVLVRLEVKPKTVREAFLNAYKRAGGIPVEWDNRLAV
ncbi:hypothetical protein FDJ25_gp052 [Vibrio phage Aphrodite1]|uniref:Uncharacterized protein n=1 Tax=Vibrio phage Aphrodite1 TaxID=2070057 RepID=A0A2I7QHY0_9CAUD|nr:hypothetical protein FDJ25_gp052 [Vibrio phage Aphrodite1]AUR81005.1 hypothetical protein Aphrodite1_0151 [Vibrio phage Aphrodite1]